MKTLPDSPSLDHLRQQAKDVLQMLQVVRPDARLSDAQALVAEQYGFRTWPDLKAEVDRRSVVVTHAEDGVAGAVAAAFDLGRPEGGMVALGRQWRARRGRSRPAAAAGRGDPGDQESDPERREHADRAVPWLLKDLPSRSKFEAALDALD